MATSCIAIIMLLPCIAKAQSTPSLTELIDSAINNNHELISQQLDIELTKVDLKNLKYAYLPRASVTVADAFLLSSFGIKSSPLEIPQLNIKFNEGHNRFTMTSNLATAGISSSALIYSGGKVPRLKNALNEKVNAQTAIMEKSRQGIINDITATYDQLALLAQIRIVLNESEKRLAENKKTADKTLEYGLITPYEHQKIEVAQAQLASKILDYESKRAIVIEKLFLLTKISKERLLLIDNKMQLLAADTLKTDIENRAEIKALNTSITAAGYKIKAEKTWIVPKVEALGSVGYLGFLAGHVSSTKPIIQGGDNLSSSLPNLNILPVVSVGVGVKWNLFDGHEGKNEVQKAMIEKQQLENEKDDVLEKSQLNLTKSVIDYSLAASQVVLSTNQQQTAWNALTQANKEYKTGLIKSSQLIDAEEDFEAAALGYIQAVYNQRRAAINLMQATGSLNIEAIQQ